MLLVEFVILLLQYLEFELKSEHYFITGKYIISTKTKTDSRKIGCYLSFCQYMYLVLPQYYRLFENLHDDNDHDLHMLLYDPEYLLYSAYPFK